MISKEGRIMKSFSLSGGTSLTIPFRGHIILIVTFSDGIRWAVEVCFGGDGPTQPMQLIENFISRNMGTQDARYLRGNLPGQVSRALGHRMWLYQCRNHEPQPWKTFYGFNDALEWLPQDFDVVNCFTSGSPESAAVTNVAVVKFLRRPVSNHTEPPKDCRQEIFGKRILANEVRKENLGGRTRVMQVFRTEDERISALKMWFGIELTEEERLAIRGHSTELGVEREA